MARIPAMEWARLYYAADSIRHGIGTDAMRFVADNPDVPVGNFVKLRDSANILAETLQQVAASMREKETAQNAPGTTGGSTAPDRD